MEFKDYGFKPVDVINGLNKYYSEKDSKYLDITKGKHAYWHLLDKEVTDAINWLREEHNIFYTPGMKLEDDSKDIFDNPRYRFLSELSSELGIRTIVGPGNAEKVENDILRIIKHRDEQSKAMDDNRREFLRNLRCELGVPRPVVYGCIEEMELDILERIGKLKEGNWPCENSNSFVEFMKRQFPKECKKWNVVPLDSGSVHDWVQYIFGVLDEWRKRATKAEKELERAWSHCGKLKGMLNTMYGASCGDNVLPCYRDTCNNPKAIRERDAANDALFELRAKIREVYREVFGCSMEIDYGNTSALNDILEDYKFQKKLKEKAEEKAVSNKMELQQCRAYILKVFREIFDCSNGDPEGSDEETLNDILEEYKRVVHNFEERTADWSKVNTSLSNLKRQCEDDRKLLSSVRAERNSNKAKYLVFLDKLAKILGVSYSNPNYLPAKEQDILAAVETLSENYDATNRVLEDKRKDYDNLEALYKSSLKLLGEYVTEAKDILGIDTCDKDTVISAIKALKSTYNSLRNDYDEVCEGYTKLKKEYDELGKAYSSVLKWNNSYADVRRLLGVSADADAGEMVGALNDLVCERERCERRSKNWYSRYQSEHERANGEHKRAEKALNEVRDWTKRCCSAEQALNARGNEETGLQAFKNEIRKLKDEKTKVINALGQDIWDDCVK